jgi:hypothetical protein
MYPPKPKLMKFLKITSLILLLIWVQSCAPRPQTQETRALDTTKSFKEIAWADFFNNLKTLCGLSFSGRQIFMAEGRESWEDRTMIMYVDLCDDDAILIPFHLDEDKSRTWMFLNEEGQLRFRHDHRHEDGTPEDITMYGGYSDPERATAFYQVFPADEYTIELIPRSIASEWVVELKYEMTVFSYQLHHEGELIFQADFDLRSPL